MDYIYQVALARPDGTPVADPDEARVLLRNFGCGLVEPLHPEYGIWHANLTALHVAKLERDGVLELKDTLGNLTAEMP